MKYLPIYVVMVMVLTRPARMKKHGHAGQEASSLKKKKKESNQPSCSPEAQSLPPMLILERSQKSVACLNRPRGGSRPADWPPQRSRGSSWGDARR